MLATPVLGSRRSLGTDAGRRPERLTYRVASSYAHPGRRRSGRRSADGGPRTDRGDSPRPAGRRTGTPSPPPSSAFGGARRRARRVRGSAPSPSRAFPHARPATLAAKRRAACSSRPPPYLTMGYLTWVTPGPYSASLLEFEIGAEPVEEPCPTAESVM